MKKILSKKNKNILFTEAGALFGYRGFTQQFLLEAQAIKKQNYNIKVVAFEYPKGFIRKKKTKMYKEVFRSSKIKYIIVPLLYESNSLLGRITEFINIFILGLVVFFCDIHIIHAHDRISAYYATLLKKVLKIQLIYDIHGVSIEEAIYSKRLKKNTCLHKKLNEREHHIVKNAYKIFCVSDKMRDYVCSKYDADISKFLITPTSVDTSLFSYSKEIKIRSRSSLCLKNKFVVLYMGHANSWQLTEGLVSLFKIVREKKDNAHFLILTDKRELYENKFKKLRIGKEHYSICWVEHEIVPDYAIAADMAVLIRDQSIINRVSAPVKFGEYLALGLPVIVTKGIGDTSDIINKHHVGTVLEDLSLKEIQAGVENILSLIHKNGFKLSERCNAVAKNFLSIEVSINKFISVYDQN